MYHVRELNTYLFYYTYLNLKRFEALSSKKPKCRLYSSVSQHVVRRKLIYGTLRKSRSMKKTRMNHFSEFIITCFV